LTPINTPARRRVLISAVAWLVQFGDAGGLYLGYIDLMRFYLALATFLALPSAALSQVIGDAARGETLAVTVCAQCHAVQAGERHSPNVMAPNFTAIATTLGMTDRALRVWLESSHPTMPNIVLSTEERDDVVAYILSLKSAQ
jgi:mono/diheme cytochrome c family protein